MFDLWFCVYSLVLLLFFRGERDFRFDLWCDSVKEQFRKFNEIYEINWFHRFIYLFCSVKLTYIFSLYSFTHLLHNFYKIHINNTNSYCYFKKKKQIHISCVEWKAKNFIMLYSYFIILQSTNAANRLLHYNYSIMVIVTNWCSNMHKNIFQKRRDNVISIERTQGKKREK